jgi:hypothetical protein
MKDMTSFGPSSRTLISATVEFVCPTSGKSVKIPQASFEVESFGYAYETSEYTRVVIECSCGCGQAYEV